MYLAEAPCTVDTHTHKAERAFSRRPRAVAEQQATWAAHPYCVLPRILGGHSPSRCGCGRSAFAAHWQMTHPSAYLHEQSEDGIIYTQAVTYLKKPHKMFE